MQEASESYVFAFEDKEFIERPEVRGIRFQLELLKADLILRENDIDHMIVVFGSARFVSQEKAEKMISEAKNDTDTAKALLALKNSALYESAREFGRLVATHNLMHSNPKKRLHICTGGGPGIMEAANRGAFETGDLSIGLNISLPREQTPNRYITPALCFRFHYFALRKMHFLLRARAIVVYPGGFGSFDEIFEVLTLIQTKKMKPLPVILVGTEHWKTIVRFDMLVDQGLIDAEDLNILTFVDSAKDAWDTIQNWYEFGN
ncbi:LOG family protein [Orrella sp. NBD-18]|uniref:AMP nucleosidase n=2 Tax=Sheuella amnicola TaxID=2707330 RepID=A0A6B2R2U0_9BURK|nr:LOG family protein [Sheuella amnicola]HBI82374.1 3-isopropylmalate dehydrogenase [Alcaligenaceae bacterium]